MTLSSLIRSSFLLLSLVLLAFVASAWSFPTSPPLHLSPVPQPLSHPQKPQPRQPSLSPQTLQNSKPLLPLSSSSRWIVDNAGNRFKLRCINWAAHLETNIPEGLHRQPLSSIAAWIAAAGFTCVRLSYSIDMALHPHTSVRDSFLGAAAAANVSATRLLALYHAATQLNPFLATASVRDVHGATVAALWAVGVVTVLDNHVSRAGSCCTLADGNGFWSDAPFASGANSRFFDPAAWLAGLQATAVWARNQTGVVGMALRNEPRTSGLQALWAGWSWYQRMQQAAEAVHALNSDVLVIVAGVKGATDLALLIWGLFDTGAWHDKNVWEAHDYSFTSSTPDIFGSCGIQKMEYGALYGFVLVQDRKCTGPLFVSEFGVDFGKEGTISDADQRYLSCLVEYLEENDADWALWTLQGSYYVRDGEIDREETWGVLDAAWVDWRDADFASKLGRLWNIEQLP
ncbi:hypothetical protein TD95_000974 [Thielaviopsis punctulata]|uniref:Glycoside hydrolase family 5 domain-containing protein n=1 Tax=Thielaviopsis punctulata TaxID=72032 RepID=A0A0F4ZC77_9PEZI|nr:hypothetical protein TD95_000974 [Thielaviopsis punctulata]